jgi:hypothetical protein
MLVVMLEVGHAIFDKGIVKGKILECQLFFIKYCDLKNIYYYYCTNESNPLQKRTRT